MPKVVNPSTLIKELGGSQVWSYAPQSKHLVCKLCSFSAPTNRKSVLQQHVNCVRHKNNLRLFNEGEKRTQQLLTLTSTNNNNNSDNIFNTDLVKALVSANIPFLKIENKEMKDFLEKYMKKTLPSDSTLTRILEKESKLIMEKIKEKMMGKSLFVSINETTDRLGRPMCMVLAGPLDGDFLDRPYLIDLVNLGAANNQTVQQSVNSALFKVLGGKLSYERIRLFLTDGAAYCVKAGKGLMELYPNLIHCLCLAHGLNRVAEMVRYEFSKVDKLIAEVKKIFIKCARRRAEFTASCQIPLPPEPVLTR